MIRPAKNVIRRTKVVPPVKPRSNPGRARGRAAAVVRRSSAVSVPDAKAATVAVEPVPEEPASTNQTVRARGVTSPPEVLGKQGNGDPAPGTKKTPPHRRPGGDGLRVISSSLRGHPREKLWTKFLRTRWRKHRNLLVEAYMPLVRSIAENIASRLPRSVESEDLVSVGIFGLLQSVESFDPERGTKFETFCRRRIRGAIIDELRSQDFLSREARLRSNLVAQATQRLLQELGREPDLREIAEAMGLGIRDVDAILSQASSNHVVSLDAALRDPLLLEDDGLVSNELVDGDHEPFEMVLKKDLLERIAESLKDAEREILLLRYRDGLTMRGIGRVLGVSESRVCQLHSGVLARLQRRLAPED